MRRQAFPVLGFGGHVAFTLPLKPAQHLDVAIHFCQSPNVWTFRLDLTDSESSGLTSQAAIGQQRKFITIAATVSLSTKKRRALNNHAHEKREPQPPFLFRKIT